MVPLIFDLIQSNQSSPELSFLDIEVKTRVRRYQRGNLNPFIEEEQNIQWPKTKVQKDEQRSTRHTHKTKDHVTRTTLNTGRDCSQNCTVVSYTNTFITSHLKY